MRDALPPAGERERNLAHDALGLAWHDESESPGNDVLAMASSVPMYLTTEQNRHPLCDLVERFTSSGICLDVESTAGMRKSSKVVER